MKKNFHGIAAAALSRFDAVVEWLGIGGGKDEGREYVCLNPRRNDRKPGSFKINRDSGAWRDWADDGDAKGGDLIALTRYLLNLESQSDAAEQLAAFVGIDSTAAQNGDRQGARKRGANSSTAQKKPDTSPSAAPGGGWRIVVPVPSDATPLPKAHSKRGKPVLVHEYRDGDGRLLGFVTRHDPCPPEFPKKDYFPWTWRVNSNGRAEWRNQSWPDPRPCYGLDRHVARPEATVVFHEGEKSADAGNILLPDMVSMAWPNGSGGVDKVDFTPLAGATVLLWADHDAAGKKAMTAVAKSLRRAGAVSVRHINIGLFEKFTVDANGRMVDRLVPLKAKWDCADAVAEGWTTEAIAELLRRDDSLLGDLPEASNGDAGVCEAPAASDEKSGPYVLDEDIGLYYIETDRDGRVRQVRLSGPMSIPALARDGEGGSWGPVIEFKDRDGQRRREVIPYRMFLGVGTDGVRQLADMGLEIGGGPQTLERIKGYIVSEQPPRRARLVEQTGWHGRAFVLPDCSIGETDETLLFRAGRRAHGVYATRGSLSDWQLHIGNAASGNPRLLFALAVALAGPLLKVLGAANAIFHWVGDSSIGKSGALVAAGSVWGPPDVQVHSWRQTSNAAEYTIAQHNDCCGIFDELKEADAKEIGAMSYMAGNGRGKGRAHHAGGLREGTSWRIVGLSSGEIGIGDHLASAGQKHHAGQQVRFIELPADAGAGLGMWSDVRPCDGGGKQFTDQLKKWASRYHGTAGREFVTVLCRRLDSIPREFRDHDTAFNERFRPSEAGGQVQRVLSSFSLVAFAGELAARWEIVPWSRGAAFEAAGSLFNEWLRDRPSHGNAEDEQIIAHVRGVMERNWQSRFVDWKRVEESESDLSRMAAVHDSFGFRKKDYVDDFLFYVTRARFAEEFATKGGFKAKRVAAVLKARGVLKCDADSTTLRETLPNGDPRSYCLVGKKLWGIDA